MITIPDTVWERLLIEFRRPRGEIERVAYLDGVALGDSGVVTTLTFPDAVLAARRYTVSASAMSEAGKHLRAYRLLRLAQVHTHGGRWVGHSEVDDHEAYSREPGAVSIVLPYHARHQPGLAEAGVHVREADGWRQLQPDEVSLVVRLVPGLCDFRRR